MKLKDIIANLDKSDQSSDYVDLEDMMTEVNYTSSGFAWEIKQDKDNPRLKCYWIANHICTDTWVGLRAYFLDDKLVCCSHQAGRKCDEHFEWVSLESKLQVREYIKSLDASADEVVDEPSLLDMEEDMGIGYPIQFTGQMLRNKVYYKGELVDVIRDDSEGYKNFHTITIKFDDGLTTNIDVRETLVPWYTVPPTGRDVHTEHCCVDHGCKYNSDDCTVASGLKVQSYPCEECQYNEV